MSPPTDFESAASTNSATGARTRIIAAHGGGSTTALYRRRPGPRRHQWIGLHHRIDRMSVDRLRGQPGSLRAAAKGCSKSIPMTATTLETWNTLRRTRPIAAAAMIIALGGMATVVGAWFFQYGL